MVRQNRTRRDRPWRVHFGARSQAKAHALHPSVQPAAETGEVEVLRSITPNQFGFSCYSPLVVHVTCRTRTGLSVIPIRASARAEATVRAPSIENNAITMEAFVRQRLQWYIYRTYIRYCARCASLSASFVTGGASCRGATW